MTSTTRRCIRSGALIAAAIRHPTSSGGTCPVDRTIEARTPVPTNSASRPPTQASSIRCAPIACLGVSDFGQSGDVDDLYRYFGIDAATIVGAAIDLLETNRP